MSKGSWIKYRPRCIRCLSKEGPFETVTFRIPTDRPRGCGGRPPATVGSALLCGSCVSMRPDCDDDQLRAWLRGVDYSPVVH